MSLSGPEVINLCLDLIKSTLKEKTGLYFLKCQVACCRWILNRMALSTYHLSMTAQDSPRIHSGFGGDTPGRKARHESRPLKWKDVQEQAPGDCWDPEWHLPSRHRAQSRFSIARMKVPNTLFWMQGWGLWIFFNLLSWKSEWGCLVRKVVLRTDSGEVWTCSVSVVEMGRVPRSHASQLPLCVTFPLWVWVTAFEERVRERSRIDIDSSDLDCS